eukprot:2972888-Prymnesium_polylepis.1
MKTRVVCAYSNRSGRVKKETLGLAMTDVKRIKIEFRLRAELYGRYALRALRTSLARPVQRTTTRTQRTDY